MYGMACRIIHGYDIQKSMKRTKIIDALTSEDYGASIIVKGWVRTRRGSKSVNFIALNHNRSLLER